MQNTIGDVEKGMDCWDAETWEKISIRVDQLLVLCDIPRGAKVASAAYIKPLAKLYEEIEKSFTFINELAFPGFWPIRDMVIQKCANQRSYDSRKAKAKQHGKTVLQHRKRVQQERAENKATSDSPTRSLSPPQSTHTDLSTTDQKKEPSAAPSQPVEDSNDDMYASEPEVDNELPPKFALWAKCGPLIANIVFDVKSLKLPLDWADYKTEEDRERWEGVDDDIEQEIYGEHGFQSDVNYWLPYFEERFSSKEEFEVVWKEFCDDYLEVEDPRLKNPSKTKLSKRSKTPPSHKDPDSNAAYQDPLSDLSSLPASPEPKKRQKLSKKTQGSGQSTSGFESQHRTSGRNRQGKIATK